MRIFRIIALLCVTYLLIPSSADAQYVYGRIWTDVAGGSQYDAYASGFQVRFCRAQNSSGLIANSEFGTGECYTTGLTDAVGTYPGITNITGYFWMFAWSPTHHWGADDRPVGEAPVYIYPSQPWYTGNYPTQINTSSRPRPLAPLAFYPTNNATGVPRSLTLEWTKGLDSLRTSPSWPVTYDLFTSAGGGPEALTVPDLPCNANGSGRCTFYVAGPLEPYTEYTWRVVAKMDVGLEVLGVTVIHDTSSSTFALETGAN